MHTLPIMLLGDYDDLLALCRLRHGDEYETEFVADAGAIERARVHGIAIASLTARDEPSVSLVIELDEGGRVIQDWLGKEPVKEMNAWPDVTWQEFPADRSPDDFARSLFVPG